MIGKRGIIFKRPAVLWAAAFVAGIVLAGYPAGIMAGVAAGAVIVCALSLRRLQKGGRRVSAADRLLLFVPVFLLFGFFVMEREASGIERFRMEYAECMEAGREVLAEGTVSHIRRTKSGVRMELEDTLAASYHGDGTVRRPVGRLLVYLEDTEAENGEIKHGQKIFVYGRGSEFEEASNPGCFDAKAYYFSLGITGAIHGKTVRITDVSYHRLSQALFQGKNKLLESYVTYLGEEGAGVIASMLLGERALLPEETEELYRHGGISHILAISGLHVSLIGMALYELLRKTVLGRNGAIPVACAGVILYGTFVEAGTSTKRAVIMFLLLLIATALGRTYDTLSAMSVSVIVLLCGNPGALFTASFQLSFAAAYGSAVLAGMLGKGQRERTPEEQAVWLAKREGKPFLRLWTALSGKIKGMLVFGFAIQAVTFPFTVYHFFEYPTYGMLLNPVVVPLMTILLLCGLLSGVCGLFLPWLGYFFAGGAGGVLWLYELLCKWAGTLPCSLLLIGRPVSGQIVVYFVLLAISLYFRQWRGEKRAHPERGGGNRLLRGMESPRAALCILALLPLCLLPLPGAGLEATFLDVGQGDGIVLRERRGAVLLVDGGSTSVQRVGEQRILPYLKACGIRVIDCAFISHTDSDHISGVKEILERMPVYSEYHCGVAGYTGTPVIKSIALPMLEKPDEAYLELVESATRKKVKIYYLASGDRMLVGRKFVFSCLAPGGGTAYEDKNDASMVLRATYGAFDLLLTGDMDQAGEETLLENGLHRGISGTVAYEALKVAHHGSRTSSSEAFLMSVKPAFCVISCGRENRYGHPHEEVLERLEEAGVTVYRTDEGGAIRVTVRRGSLYVQEFLKRH